MGWVSLVVNYADSITLWFRIQVAHPNWKHLPLDVATWPPRPHLASHLGATKSIARSHQRCALNNWSDKWQAHNLEWTMRIHSILDIFVNQVAELNDMTYFHPMQKKTSGDVRAHITWRFPKTYSAVCQWIFSAPLDGDYGSYSPKAGKRRVDHVTVETVETVGKFLKRISPEWFLSPISPTNHLIEGVSQPAKRVAIQTASFSSWQASNVEDLLRIQAKPRPSPVVLLYVVPLQMGI